MNASSIDQFFDGCQSERPVWLNVRESGPGPGPVEARRLVLTTPFAVVGSDPRADLVLDHPGVRPRHCFLQLLGPKGICLNLGAEGGLTRVDGRAEAGWVGRGPG